MKTIRTKSYDQLSILVEKTCRYLQRLSFREGACTRKYRKAYKLYRSQQDRRHSAWSAAHLYPYRPAHLLEEGRCEG